MAGRLAGTGPLGLSAGTGVGVGTARISLGFDEPPVDGVAVAMTPRGAGDFWNLPGGAEVNDGAIDCLRPRSDPDERPTTEVVTVAEL